MEDFNRPRFGTAIRIANHVSPQTTHAASADYFERLDDGAQRGLDGLLDCLAGPVE